jgi:hypothetical protein
MTSPPATIDGWRVATTAKLSRALARQKGYKYSAQVYHPDLLHNGYPLLIRGTSASSPEDALARAIARGRAARKGDEAVLAEERKFQDMARLELDLQNVQRRRKLH